MGYLKSLVFCALFLCLSLISFQSFSQCDSKIKFEVKPGSQGLSTITMRCLDGSKLAKIQLYDLNEGKVKLEVEKIINNDLSVIFENVKPSIYAFYVWLPGCKKPIVISGEKVGVTVEN